MITLGSSVSHVEGHFFASLGAIRDSEVVYLQVLEKRFLMRPSFLLFTLIVGTALLVGCVHSGPKLDLSQNGVQKTLVGQLKENVFKKEWVEYNCADSGYYNQGIQNTSFTTFSCNPVTKNPEDASRIRNHVVDNGLGLIDSAYTVYIRDVRKKRSVGEFIADLAEIGASTAIGITNGERAIQVIGVALT